MEKVERKGGELLQCITGDNWQLESSSINDRQPALTDTPHCAVFSSASETKPFGGH